MKSVLSSRKFVLVLVLMVLVVTREVTGLDPETITGLLTVALAYLGVEGARDIVIEAKRRLPPPDAGGTTGARPPAD